MQMSLQKLQEIDLQALEIKAIEYLQKSQEDFNRVFDYQQLFYLSNIIRFELIRQHHNNSLTGYF